MVPLFGGADSVAPVITISRGTETSGTQTLPITISWCDNVSLKSTTRHITFNSVDVTSSFTYVTGTQPGCGAYATSTGNVTLASGSNTLSANILDNALNYGSSAVTYTYSPASYGVAVTPDNQPVTANAKRSNSFTFTVTNTGNVSEQLNLAVTCTGTVTGCPTSLSPITLANGALGNVLVSYQAGAGSDTGTVQLRATYSGDGSITDVGSIRVTSQWEWYLAADGSFNNQDNQQASLCATNCFAATYAQSTTPYYSLGAPRNVTLVYSGDHIAVRPFLYEDVSLEPGAYPVQQYWLEAKINGTSVTFLNGETRLHFTADSTNPGRVVRLAGQFDGSSYTTGLYNLAIIVTAQYTDHNDTYVDSISVPRLLIDNERQSLVARGWTLAGVQHLYPQSDGSVLITEGGGSALYFRCWPSASPCATSYQPPAGEFSSLTHSGTGGSLIFTRAYRDGTNVVFNNLGQMVSATDRFGNTSIYGYDAYGRLVTIADPYRLSWATGRHSLISLSYNSYGLAKITEPSPWAGDSAGGRVTIFTVAVDSTLRSVQDPDGKSTQFSYDAPRRLASVVSRRGDTTTFAYNSHSWKLDSVVSPKVPIDAGGGATTVQAPVVRYVPWQTVGVPIAATSGTPFVPVSPTSVAGTVTDPEQHATSYTVDRWGQPLVVTEPLGRTTTITRSGALAIRVVYPSGAKDTAVYNASGLMTYSAPAGQDPSNITYASYALPQQVTRAHQPTQTFTYGANGRDSLVTVGGLTTRYYADGFGRDTAISDPAGHAYKLHYETNFGNLDSTLASGTGVPVRYTLVRFDGYGRDSIHKASGQPGDTASYDALNRVIRLAAPGHRITNMAYDPLFRTAVTDAKGQVFRDSTNALGWRVQRTDPSGAVVKYRYNRDGLLTSYTNRRQQIVSRTYDALHRILAKFGSTAVADSFAYSVNGTQTLGWNAVSRDSIFTNAVTGWTDSVVTRFSTSAGSQRFLRYYRATALQQLDSLGLAGPSTIALVGRRYFWNASTGTLDSIKVGSNRFTLHYNGEALPDSVTYPNAAKRSIVYSSVHQPIQLSFSLASLDSVLTRFYRYDSVGQIVEEDRKAKNGTNEDMSVFRYDLSSQLVGRQLESLNNDTTCTNPPNVPKGDFGIDCTDTTYAVKYQTNGYQYDSVGNLRQDYDSTLGAATTGTYLTGDRQSGWAGAAYTYDADGNRITKTVGSHTVSYHWTADGELDTVTAGTNKLAYAYNAFGQLVRRSRNGVPERYLVWDRGQLLIEVDGSATHRVGEYAYAPGTDAPIELITGSGTSAPQQYVQDAAGNVIGLFNTNTVITERQTYTPWGTEEAGSVTALADTNRLRWKGLVWEGDSTQLYYVRARWYDPASRRFVSEDPSGLDGGINPYVYGGNSPVSNRDPNGMYYTSGAAGCYYGWLICGGGGDESVHGGGGVGGSGLDEAYMCDVQSLGAQACLDEGAAYFAGDASLGVGWTFDPASILAIAAFLASDCGHAWVGFSVTLLADASMFVGIGEVVEGAKAAAASLKAGTAAFLTSSVWLGTDHLASLSSKLSATAASEGMVRNAWLGPLYYQHMTDAYNNPDRSGVDWMDFVPLVDLYPAGKRVLNACH